MKDMKTSSKLKLSFSIMVIIAAIVGVIGIIGMYCINRANDNMYKHEVAAISTISEIRESVELQRLLLRDSVLYGGDRTAIDSFKSKIAAEEETTIKRLAEYETTIYDESHEADYRKAKNVYDSTFTQYKKDVLDASYIGCEEGLSALNNPGAVQMIAVMLDGFAASKNNSDNFARAAVENNDKQFRTMMIIDIIVLLIAVAVAYLLAFYISGVICNLLIPMSAFFKKAGTTGDTSLAQEDQMVIGKYVNNKDELGALTVGAVAFIERLNKVSDVLKAVAGGDLTTELAPLSEKDMLGLSLINMTENLTGMVANIQTSTTQVSTGAKQVADGAQTLAQGATEQSASIDGLSSALNDISKGTKERAEVGADMMNHMVKAVGDINNASNEISRIIKVIDDIAFQTNILALNASVEAARAGVHGKGFAVVAEEVKNLANRSQSAAAETNQLIANSLKLADDGAKIACETQSALESIVVSIDKLAEVMEGIEQISVVVQQNSATAQESAAASEEMSGQSDLLQQLLSQFKLKVGAESSRSRSTAARTPKMKQMNSRISNSYESGINSYNGGSFGGASSIGGNIGGSSNGGRGGSSSGSRSGNIGGSHSGGSRSSSSTGSSGYYSNPGREDYSLTDVNSNDFGKY